MTFNRRVFLVLLYRPPVATTSLEVKVLEVFASDRGLSAILVHHANEAGRERLATWLRANPKTLIRVRDRSGKEFEATIFRVRMCFGRGLILLDVGIQVREGDVLTILSA
jgi:hypothetical protein